LLQEVLLVVVEVRRHVPRIGLLGRRLVRPELAAIGLDPFDQTNVLQAGRSGFDRRYQIPQHRSVNRGLLAFPGALLIRGVEQVGDLTEPSKLVLAVRRVEQVYRQELSPTRVVVRLTGQPNNLPTFEGCEMFDQAPADNAAGPGDKSDFV